ncbi:NRT1/ PTR FAMILY 2.13 [Spatholobus suberectus]|nr:NRT1/ PTR FAMILY 2.13 [Spatholobus suberectus]
MEMENKRKDTRSFWSTCYKNWKSRKSLGEDNLDSSNSRAMEKKPGWKAISYILGNQIIERIATVGMMANFMVYLLQVFNLGQVAATNVIGIWTGVSNFIPIIGACVADAYLGKFRTIAISSFGTLVGMVILTLTAWVPQLHPPSCTSPQQCVPSTSTQLGILIFGLCWLAVGTGVAAYKKHRLQIPVREEVGVYYDPPLDDKAPMKMPLTKQLRCLNKAALIRDNELNAEGCVKNPWRLCSILQVEEVKCLIKMLPIWASGILCLIPLVQQGTFPVSQALKMDRHLGPHFELPAASYNVVSLITIGIFLPCFDLFLQPALAKVTKQEEGLTSLQKIVIGDICSILTMVSAGLVEWRRRGVAISHGAPDGIAPMSAMWLAPQYVLLGLCEMFTLIGHIQFYSSESPEKMKSIGNSLQYLVMAFSIYVGTLVVNVVHQVTQKHGGIVWLNDDINAGRLDYYYFLIAGLGALNLVYILFCVKRYRYKVNVKVEVKDTP